MGIQNMNKKIKNCFLLCLLIACSNMVHTSSVANTMKQNSKQSIKSHSKKFSDNDATPEAHPTIASNTFALLEENHKNAEGTDPEQHFEIEKDNFALLKELLAHYKQHQKENTFPHNHKNVTHHNDTEQQGENLKDMIESLEKVIANGERNLQNMREQIAKHKEHVKDALQQNLKREVAIAKIHEQDNEVRQKFKDVDTETAFEMFAKDGQDAEGLQEVREQFKNLRNKMVNKTNTENSFAQVQGDNGAQHGTKVAKACVAGFFGVIPPSFAYKRHPDFGTSDFHADGYHRQGALYYKNCKHGYRNVAGVCWADCAAHWRDFGAICTRCSWHTCGGWFKYPCLQCHSYGKHTYGTHIITLFDSRVKCRDGNRYKSGALCYRDCNRSNEGLENCGIGACASGRSACIAGVVTMIAELLLGMVTFITFVASFGTSGAGASQMTAAGARSLLKKAGAKAVSSFQFVKKIASNRTFRKKLGDKAVAAAKKKFREDAGYFARDKYIELQCRRVADSIMDESP